MRVDFAHCDILTVHDRLLARMHDEPKATIWWSNAFFPVPGHWHYSEEQRRTFYRPWIEALPTHAPRLFLYGSHFNNSSVTSHAHC